MEGWLKPWIQHGHAPFKVVTAEEILRKALLHLLGLTEKQLKEYEGRPRVMVQTRLLVHAPLGKKNSGSIGERCANFLQRFEMAKNVFKSLADNALLKAWEFTLASFSDIKYEFSRWNLYSSLGLGSNDPGESDSASIKPSNTNSMKRIGRFKRFNMSMKLFTPR